MVHRIPRPMSIGDLLDDRHNFVPFFVGVPMLPSIVGGMGSR
jgi:hypothetical protein